MSDRTTDQLAREVRPWLFRDGMPIEDAVAALAELEAQAKAGRDERDRADRYEFALTTLHADGEGGFVTPLRSEQEVVEDCIRVANERRRAALAAAAPSPADQEEA